MLQNGYLFQYQQAFKRWNQLKYPINKNLCYAVILFWFHFLLHKTPCKIMSNQKMDIVGKPDYRLRTSRATNWNLASLIASEPPSANDGLGNQKPVITLNTNYFLPLIVIRLRNTISFLCNLYEEYFPNLNIMIYIRPGSRLNIMH